MTRDYPEPLPGDFDQKLYKLDPADVQVVEASQDRHRIIRFTPNGNDATALQRIADEQDESPGEGDGSDPPDSVT